jgi:hypothetical protein
VYSIQKIELTLLRHEFSNITSSACTRSIIPITHHTNYLLLLTPHSTSPSKATLLPHPAPALRTFDLRCHQREHRQAEMRQLSVVIASHGQRRIAHFLPHSF